MRRCCCVYCVVHVSSGWLSFLLAAWVYEDKRFYRSHSPPSNSNNLAADCSCSVSVYHSGSAHSHCVCVRFITLIELYSGKPALHQHKDKIWALNLIFPWLAMDSLDSPQKNWLKLFMLMWMQEDFVFLMVFTSMLDTWIDHEWRTTWDRVLD